MQNKKDLILINDLVVRCIIGVSEEERREKQDVVINLVIETDFAKPAQTDSFPDALDYRSLKKKILNLVEKSNYHLLEALSQAIASACLKEPKVFTVKVKVEKPSALVSPEASESKSSGRERTLMPKAYISIGSNINPRLNVIKALRLLLEHQPVTEVSTVYRTKPELNKKQPYFYNCVAEMKTTLSPEQLKHEILRKIEKQLGRKRTKDKFAPRTIDLDLIAYSGPKTKLKNINLPDPEILQRKYLAAALIELNPRLIKINNSAKSLRNSLRPLLGYTKLLKKELKL